MPVTVRELVPFGANDTLSGDNAIDVSVGAGGDELPPPPPPQCVRHAATIKLMTTRTMLDVIFNNCAT